MTDKVKERFERIERNLAMAAAFNAETAGMERIRHDEPEERMNMINQEELAICRKRGHVMYVSDEWEQCKACGMWVRSRKVTDEREDVPPEERGSGWRAEQMYQETQHRLKKLDEREGS